MKFYELITEGKTDPEIVKKFADVSPSQRSYYIMKWAEEKGIDSDDAMEMAGYERGDYIGAGAYMWNYVGESKEAQTESLQALANHVKQGTALCDSPFRHGSQAYIETFQYAKKLREAGALPELDWESEEMLATDVGEKVTLENGETVWLDIPYLIEDDDVNDSGMIGEPDAYYDEDERKQAYNDLQDALDSANSREHDYVVDGICPECGGSSYMDGDYEGEEDSCYGWGNFGCDEGEMEGATWKEIMDHDKRNAERQKAKDNYPGDEEVVDQVANMVKNMDDPRDAVFQLQADYPNMSKAQRASIVAKAMKKAGLTTENTKAYESNGDSGEAMVAKMLAKALGDENRWTDMSASELYAELESENSYMADMIKYLAKMLYDVRLEENKLPEAEYQGKDVELNKPKRGGSKKYYVYVKNPKTGNVKKISFGDPGLKTKSGNKDRAKSFAARHNCEKKNDKTKAGYWACRLPRYGLVKGGKWW